jgi:uncharacterized protein with HEPN domain
MYNNPNFLIQDIHKAISKIFSYTKGMNYETFSADDKTIDAVIRNFEIIGEAVVKLPDNFKETHSEVDWFRVKGMRNRIVHDYRNVNLIIIWETIENNLPDLQNRIEDIIKDMGKK